MPFYLVVLLLSIAAIITILAKKLTIIAAFTGVLIATLIFKGFSFTGLIIMAIFFILGNTATSFKIKKKQQLQIAETNKGKRNAAQVIANAGMAALLGLLAWQFPQYGMLFTIMMASCFSSATADTLSSEMGNIYGSKFYNILSFKKDSRGLNGVVSIEGTLFGIGGSLVCAIIYAIGKGWDLSFFIIILAGTAGNLYDSLLGATLERRGAIGNNVVNFLNTLFAAFFGGILYVLLVHFQ